jgi:hypothetical protein
VVVSHGAVNRQVLVAFDPGIGNPGTLPQDNGCFNTLDLRNDDSWTGAAFGPRACTCRVCRPPRASHPVRSRRGSSHHSRPGCRPASLYTEDGGLAAGQRRGQPRLRRCRAAGHAAMGVANALIQPSLFGCEPPAS